MNNENNPTLVAIHLGSLTTDGTLVPGVHLPKKSKIKSVKLMNGANISASDSNYAQVALKNGSTVVAAIDTRAAHENGLTANVAKALNIVSGQETQAAASDLSVLYNETGTMALTDAKLIVEFYPL
jgi:hypothetical protein